MSELVFTRGRRVKVYHFMGCREIVQIERGNMRIRDREYLDSIGLRACHRCGADS